MFLTSAAARYLKRGSTPKDFSVSAVLGIPPYVNFERVRLALIKTVMHHEALHARYIDNADPSYAVDPIDRVLQAPEDYFHLRRCAQAWPVLDDGMDIDIEAAVEENLSFLIPSEGRLTAAVFASGHTEGNFLVLTVHHLAVDSISWGILLRELSDHIEGISECATPELSCGNWAELMRGLPARSRETTDYWKAKSIDTHFPQQLGIENIIIDGNLTACETVSVMRILPRRYGLTPADIMLLAFGIAIEMTLGFRPTISVQGHGRYGHILPMVQSDLSSTIGWLADDYPVRLGHTLDSADPLAAAASDLPQHPEDFTLSSYYCAETAARFSDSVKPKVYFNYWGTAPTAVGCISIPNISVNRMEIGNSGIFELALQVRVRMDKTESSIQWILNGRLPHTSGVSLMNQWRQLLSNGESLPNSPFPGRLHTSTVGAYRSFGSAEV